MITNLVSSKRIIAKVLADLDLEEKDIRISDWREWIGEALEKIGAMTQFIPKVSGEDGAPIIKLTNHQAELPCDLHQLHSVSYSYKCNGPWRDMRKSTGSFSVWGGQGNECCNKYDTPIQDEIIVNLMIDLIGNIDKTEALEILNTNQNAKTILSNLIKSHGSTGRYNHYLHDLTYNVKPGYIMTNVPCGYLRLSYSSIPMDEEGYPLVPDMASFSEAIYWYITQKHYYPKRLRGEIDRRDHTEMKMSWNFYRQQAYTEAIMPNVDEMESLKNVWVRLYPNQRAHQSHYDFIGQRENIYKTDNFNIVPSNRHLRR